MTRVHFAIEELLGGGNLRAVWPAAALASVCGHETSVGIGSDVPDCDVLVVHRPIARGRLDQVLEGRRRGIRVVCDEDDALDLATDIGNEIARDHWNTEMRTIHDDALAAADAVTVSTAPLAEHYRPLNPNIHVCRNRLPERFHALRATKLLPPTVGWFGIVATHRHDLRWLRPAMEHLWVPFETLGDPRTPLVVGKPGSPVLEFTRDPDELYTTIARWSVGLVPLVDHPFNHCKCLDASTHVQTPDGAVPILAVTPGDSVWNGTRFVRVEAVEHLLPRPGLAITTERGYQIRVSPEHRLPTSLGLRRGDELSPGMSLILSPGAFPERHVQVRARLFHTRQTRDPDWEPRAPESLPLVDMDETWGELLGFFVGDGHFSTNATRISCDGVDGDVVARVIDLFDAIGLRASAKPKTMYDGTLLRGQEVSAPSTKLGEFWRLLGVVGEGRRQGRWKRIPIVPEVIHRSPRPVVAAFLRGYFEADGTVGQTVSAASKDEPLLRGVQGLLLRLGIPARLTRVTANTGYVYWTLSLRRAAVDVFAKEVGFVGQRKRDRLEAVSLRPHSNAYRPLSWEDAITSVEPCMIEPVDIQVDGRIFIADGFASHNSWLKALEYMTVGIVPIVRRLPEQELLITDGLDGYVVDEPLEMVQTANALANDREVLSTMSKAARERATEQSLENHIEEWADVLTTTGESDDG